MNKKNKHYLKKQKTTKETSKKKIIHVGVRGGGRAAITPNPRPNEDV